MAKKEKLDEAKLKEEFDALDPDEQASIRKILGIPGDEDTATTLKDILARLTKLEGAKKKSANGDGESFWDRFRI